MMGISKWPDNPTLTPRRLVRDLIISVVIVYTASMLVDAFGLGDFFVTEMAVRFVLDGIVTVVEIFDIETVVGFSVAVIIAVCMMPVVVDMVVEMEEFEA